MFPIGGRIDRWFWYIVDLVTESVHVVRKNGTRFDEIRLEMVMKKFNSAISTTAASIVIHSFGKVAFSKSSFESFILVLKELIVLSTTSMVSLEIMSRTHRASWWTEFLPISSETNGR